MNRDRFRFFPCTHLETDLLIGVPHAAYSDSMERTVLSEVRRVRKILTEYASRVPSFFTSLEPLPANGEAGEDGSYSRNAPEVETMLRCGTATRTGPMSAVAGLFAEQTGRILQQEYQTDEVLVENGGDLYILNRSELSVVIQAGDSPLSGKLALAIPPGSWGICTSSGTVGHSFSYGKADAVTVIAHSAPLADAWATSLANLVREPGDVERVLDRVPEFPEILGCVVIMGDRAGIRGEFELKPLT